MPALDNPRHERFAQELAKGRTADAAYIAAGFKANRGNAVRLKANENVQARVAEIVGRAAVRAEITADMVLRELAKIGFSDIRRAVKWGSRLVERPFDAAPEGESLEEQPHGGSLKRTRNSDDGTDAFYVTAIELLDSGDLDEDTAAAISEVAQTKEGVRIKFHDKKGALVDIGRHLGMFTDKIDHTSTDGTMSPKPTVIEFVAPDAGEE